MNELEKCKKDPWCFWNKFEDELEIPHDNEGEFRHQYMLQFSHNDSACEALKEYNIYVNNVGVFNIIK